MTDLHHPSTKPLSKAVSCALTLLRALQVAASTCCKSCDSLAVTVPVGDGGGDGADFTQETVAASSWYSLGKDYRVLKGRDPVSENPLLGFPCCSDKSSLRKFAKAHGLRAQAILAEQVKQRGAVAWVLLYGVGSPAVDSPSLFRPLEKLVHRP